MIESFVKSSSSSRSEGALGPYGYHYYSLGHAEDFLIRCALLIYVLYTLLCIKSLQIEIFTNRPSKVFYGKWTRHM